MNKLLRTEWKSVLRGAAIAGIGCTLAYMTEYVTAQDFGEYGIVLAGVLSVAANAVRKFLEA